MRMSRTVIYTLLILAVLAAVIAKHVREKAAHGPDGRSSAASAIARAQEDGTPAWVLIHSTHCVACIEMEKVYEDLELEFRDKVVFINVNCDDPAEQELMDRFELRLIPTSVLINARGEVVEKRVGAIAVEEMRAILAKLQER